ncbi:MAG: DUF3048 domain-containing protein [Eubacteriales bacterium]|nr:DUF3048 domain-containing protein [Eubacteriales bacterium]
MPDSDELDDILNEIKSFKNGEPDRTKEEPKFAINDAPAENEAEPEGEIHFDEEPKKKNADATTDDFLSFDRFESKKPAESVQPDFDNLDFGEDKNMPDNKKSNKKPIIIVAVVLAVIIAIVVAVLLINKGGDAEETTTAPVQTTQQETTAAPQVAMENPLTGSEDFNADAVGKRPVACVVENAAAARPQWGISDEKNPPDIILEGEVEGGETRMLWFYADYTAVPSQIGPTRSARPPYIKFSELFDAIFLHWGQSQTKKGTAYIGANTVFRVDNVDHINQMTYSGKVQLFGRDSSRGVSTEHTGVIYGDKIEAAIEGEGFRTEANEASYTKFSFAKDMKYDTECTALGLTFSSRTRTRDWTYNADDGMYHSTDYGTDVARENLLILFDTTEYIAKANYKNSGSAEIYCNYNLAGGKGMIACNGTMTDITWSVENGVLVLKDTNGNVANLSTGTTWIGYASSNNGGSVSDNTTK